VIFFGTVALRWHDWIGNVTQGITADYLWSNLRLYALAPLPAFDLFLHRGDALQYGANTFRTLMAVAAKLGLNAHPVPLVEEFVDIPGAGRWNTFTVYRPYYADFGLAGALGAMFVLGAAHGLIYRRARSGDHFFIAIYALSLYPLLMQFFQDQYFSLMSLWIQALAVLWVSLRFAPKYPRPAAQMTA
jgi:oligosaccharide repeat unit polymerase